MPAAAMAVSSSMRLSPCQRHLASSKGCYLVPIQTHLHTHESFGCLAPDSVGQPGSAPEQAGAGAAYLLLVVVKPEAHTEIGDICLLNVIALWPWLPVVLVDPVHLDLHTSCMTSQAQQIRLGPLPERAVTRPVSCFLRRSTWEGQLHLSTSKASQHKHAGSRHTRA